MMDEALKAVGHWRVADVRGLNENVDLAAVRTSSGGRIALVNHNTGTLEVEVTPLNVGGKIEWIDKVSGDIISVQGTDTKMAISIPAASFRYLEYRSPSYRR